jgi:polyisoprenoid-binding protein YceI
MKSIRTLFFLAASITASHAAFAQPKVLPAQSQIAFAIKEMGVPVAGKFATWSADISFDPKRPEAGKVAFTIATASATFGEPETDAEAPKAEWFDVVKFPNATFASTSIESKGNGKFEVAGKLSVKGTTKDVVVPIALTQAGATTTATGAFTIRRNEYRIGEGEWADTSQLAEDVVVTFKIALAGVSPL